AGVDGQVDVTQHVQLAEPFVDVSEDDGGPPGRHVRLAGGPGAAACPCSSAARRSTELSTAFAKASAPPKRSSVSGGMNFTSRLEVPGGMPAKWTVRMPWSS